MDFRTGLLSGLCILFGVLLFKADPTDAIATGLYGGLFTSLLTVIGLDLYERLKIYSQLKYLNSTKWVGFALVDRELKNYKAGEVEYNSSATINHDQENVLSITLKHRKNKDSDELRTWTGKIELNRNSLTRGTLTYKYSDSHEIGYKDILINSDSTYNYIYLIPADNRIYDLKKSENGMTPIYEFGTEVLRKKRT